MDCAVFYDNYKNGLQPILDEKKKKANQINMNCFIIG